MNEAEEILARLESKDRSYRGAFCLALLGLATLVVANRSWGVPDVIRAKTMNVDAGNGVVASIATYDHKIVVGTMKGSTSLVSEGEGATGAGVIVLSGCGSFDRFPIARLVTGMFRVRFAGSRRWLWSGRLSASAQPAVQRYHSRQNPLHFH